MMKIQMRQAQQMSKHGGAQHRIDPVPGMQDQLLAYPSHAGGKQHENRHPRADDLERRQGLMHHDLVDHHLREQGQSQTQQLNGERRQQHFAPDRLVPEQFGDEPPEAKRLRLASSHQAGIGLGGFGQDTLDGEDFRLETGKEFRHRERLRLIASGGKEQHPLAVAFDDQDQRHQCRMGFG